MGNITEIVLIAFVTFQSLASDAPVFPYVELENVYYYVSAEN